MTIHALDEGRFRAGLRAFLRYSHQASFRKRSGTNCAGWENYATAGTECMNWPKDVIRCPESLKLLPTGILWITEHSIGQIQEIGHKTQVGIYYLLHTIYERRIVFPVLYRLYKHCWVEFDQRPRPDFIFYSHREKENTEIFGCVYRQAKI